MIKVDLITGFLGSGKTMFIKRYAKRLIDSGLKVGILENDYGAVNVDMMLLRELEGDNCGLEMVAGACDRDCHKRRFKTKLIAMGMSGYDRVLIEPSGIFDVDEYFDVLYEEPLDRWYEAGNVIAVVDARFEGKLSETSEYLLASQTARAGKIILSKTQFASDSDISNTIAHLNSALKGVQCKRRIGRPDVISKSWDELEDGDFAEILNCGYVNEDFVKRLADNDNTYKSLYFMDVSITADRLKAVVSRLVSGEFGSVFRVKGFIRDGEGWLELNATQNELTLKSAQVGQEIIIVIGESMDENKIRELFGSD